MANTLTVHRTKFFYDTKANYIFRMGRHSGVYTPLHRHTFYELVYTLGGTCEHLHKGTVHQMQAGDLCLIRPFEQHCISRVDAYFDYLIISIVESEFYKFLQFYGDALLLSPPCGNAPLHLSSEAQEIIRCLLARLPITESEAPSDRTVRTLCSVLFSFYADPVKTAQKEQGDVLSQMMEQMSIDLSLQREGCAAMLRLSGYSMSQLTRLMKRRYGVTPHECLKAFRMRSAYRLVSESNLSLEAISHECGYRCYGYFTTQFKEMFGKTPAAHRHEKNTLRP